MADDRMEKLTIWVLTLPSFPNTPMLKTYSLPNRSALEATTDDQSEIRTRVHPLLRIIRTREQWIEGIGADAWF
jgi:hypothetical protein